MDIVATLWEQASTTTLVFWSVAFAASYFILVAAYDVFINPLAKVPGPRLASFSNAWYCYQWTSGKYVWQIEQAHRKYGPVVRIGPNEVSFSTIPSFNDIYGHRTKGAETFIKSQFYAIPQPEAGIVAERTIEKHRDTRRLLSHGFSPKALKEQEGLLEDKLDLLVHQLRDVGGEGERALSAKNWFHWMVFDIIGELSFGESFGALNAGRPHFWIDTMHDAGAMVGWFEVGRRFPLMWPLIILFMIPSGMKGRFDKFLEYSRAQTRKRVKKQDNIVRADFFSNLLSSKAQERENEEWLLANANVLVIAGSDTTSTALTAISYYLGRYPDKLAALQEEVRSRCSGVDDMKSEHLAQLPYLNAVIEEGLRLFPPTAFGLPRQSPGGWVDGVWIPKGAVVHTSVWTTTHSDRHFHRPRDFAPERWLPTTHPRAKSEFSNDILEASKPFSLGPRGCIGINLAYLELRKVIARLAYDFEWTLANEESFDFESEARFESFWIVPDVLIKYRPVGKA